MRPIFVLFLLLISSLGAQARLPKEGSGEAATLVTGLFSIPSVLASGLNAAPDGWFGHANTSRRWRSELGKGAGGVQILIGGLMLLGKENANGALNLAVGGLSYYMGRQTEKRLAFRVSPIPTSLGRQDRGLSVGVTLRL
ncbi:hypothetical protein [Armatimonas rosea]|uniref:DUF5683 domain-containing protein n=1 Tax=Armatimonas rosea TaxID=685828 RepID=A0A7W9W8X1_ARMRO|nr:hypothetical protein [Armatimonas rosea]MBB6054004.1 hypothetical protein [Armatimonas rosea]